jgi:FAD:protein FMN transferase
MSAELWLALEAMGTRFELVIHGSDRLHLRAAGEEALAEIARLHRQLSRFDRASDISWINAHAAEAPVVVEPRLFDLLDRCQRLSVATGGAFDITIGALMQAWSKQQRALASGAAVDAAIWEAARQAVGFEHMRLDPARRTIAFARRGMAIDLGAAGKGYAIDAAVEVLRAQGVTRALIHGGTSSVHGLGRSPGGAGFHPNAHETRAPTPTRETASGALFGDPGWPIAWDAPGSARRRFALHDGALSVSACHGKAFSVDGRQFGHVMDPRNGHPVVARYGAVVTGPRSFECDALSTALLVQGVSWIGALRAGFPGYDGVVA